MRKAFASSVLLLTFGMAAVAQNLFTLVPSPLTNMGNSQAAWGDLDNDGDLDIAIAGETYSSGTVTKLFRNDAGTFAEIPCTLPGVHFPSLDWGDYDRDGDLDLLITGQDSLGIPITKIAKNKIEIALAWPREVCMVAPI